jgi:hypothetical protein
MEYFVYKTDKEGILKQGFKKLGDKIKWILTL